MERGGPVTDLTALAPSHLPGVGGSLEPRAREQVLGELSGGRA